MKQFVASWKTTIIGVSLLGLGMFTYFKTNDSTVALPIITAGLGFILSKDYNHTAQ